MPLISSLRLLIIFFIVTAFTYATCGYHYAAITLRFAAADYLCHYAIHTLRYFAVIFAFIISRYYAIFAFDISPLRCRYAFIRYSLSLITPFSPPLMLMPMPLLVYLLDILDIIYYYIHVDIYMILLLILLRYTLLLYTCHFSGHFRRLLSLRLRSPLSLIVDYFSSSFAERSLSSSSVRLLLFVPAAVGIFC